MNSAGKKPANPFPDERAFEDSLIVNFHPISGHQGRFVASHVLVSIGVINDYQNNRRLETVFFLYLFIKFESHILRFFLGGGLGFLELCPPENQMIISICS
jgi:hypothetical protein